MRPPRVRVELSREFVDDFKKAPKPVREAVFEVLPFIMKNPAAYGNFFSGNWVSLQWIDLDATHGLIWRPSPLRLLRLLPLDSAGWPRDPDGPGPIP